MHKRIVVTGIGVVSSIGIGKDAFWSALLAGKSGISPVTSFDTREFPTHNGGEVKDFNPGDFIQKERIETLGRGSQLALSAAKLALKDAGLDLTSLVARKTGVAIGTTMGESRILEHIDQVCVKDGEDAIDPNLIPRLTANVLCANIAIDFKLKGPNFLVSTACAAGNYAIGFAFDQIRKGSVEIMFAGGADGFSRIAFTGFNRLLAIAPEICQPFDKNRKGMMVGEGSGVVVLETLEHALERKANIYAEILGYGLSCDAHHMTAPHAPGIAKAMEKALKQCGLAPEDVDYISAHGTGTPANDREECLAIKEVFKEHSKKLLVSSIKSMLGHTMGAASALEAIACCLAVKDDVAPPTINFETPDPDCDIDCVPNAHRKRTLNIALNNASAFGGNNACLVLKKFV